MSVIYPSVSDILLLHELSIEDTGGSSGVRDFGLVDSAVSRAQQMFSGEDLYPTLSKKTAALFESLANNHPFIEGNKRTAALSAVTFMMIRLTTMPSSIRLIGLLLVGERHQVCGRLARR